MAKRYFEQFSYTSNFLCYENNLTCEIDNGILLCSVTYYDRPEINKSCTIKLSSGEIDELKEFLDMESFIVDDEDRRNINTYIGYRDGWRTHFKAKSAKSAYAETLGWYFPKESQTTAERLLEYLQRKYLKHLAFQVNF